MGDKKVMSRLAFAMILGISVSLVSFKTSPSRNRIQGTIVTKSGNSLLPLRGIRVYLLDLDNKEKDFAETDSNGRFSIVAPTELQSFRFLYDDVSDTHWRKEEEIKNSSHPHDIGERVLYSVTQRLASVEAGEQLHLANILREIDPQR